MEQSPAVLVNAQTDVQGIRLKGPLPTCGPIPFNVVGKRQKLGISTSHQHPKTKKSPDRCQSGDEEGDNHKPPEEKQMSIFADWP